MREFQRLLMWALALSVFVVSPAAAQDAESDADPAAEPPPPTGTAMPREDLAPPNPPPPPPPPPPAEPRRETICDNRQDEDGDGLADCADADCFDNPHCQAGGDEERTNDACSDWVDNDGDGAVDCEDDDCNAPHITVCRGSWQGTAPGTSGQETAGAEEIPELTGDMSVEDLIGTGSDADGERNDYLCSDGLDNDGD
ncbi:MAG TPA: hypothetical protein ENK57_10375, partial [Polyangiaceae bacterium]|nr:hypothetical protein [Polyangiaceae bacterium]